VPEQASDVPGDDQSLVGFKRPSRRDHLGERLPIDVFHDYVWHPLMLPEFIEWNGYRVLEPRRLQSGESLAKSACLLEMSRQLFVEEFQCESLPPPGASGVVSLPYVAQDTPAQVPGEDVASHPLRRGQLQRLTGTAKTTTLSA
jgi:hypothetical protein